jgi:hypothetical protein
VAAMPTALIAVALVRAAGTPAFAIGAALVALGPALYVLRRTRRS